MKIKAEHYEAMRVAIEAILDANPSITAVTYREQGLTEKLFRWDALHASDFNICSLYHYCNDEHIDTALRKITKTK